MKARYPTVFLSAVVLAASLISFEFPVSAVAQTNEESTITTYYPSPTGSYNDLQVANAIYLTSAMTTATGSRNSGPGLVFNFPPTDASVRDDAGVIRAVIPFADDLQLQMTVTGDATDRVYIGGAPGGIFMGVPGGLLIRGNGLSSLTASFASTSSTPVLEVLDTTSHGQVVLNNVIYCP